MTTASRPSVLNRSSTILVIEDEVRSQRLLRLNLEPLGYTVITAEQVKEVHAQLEAHDPDLMVLDLWLPDGDGFEVCKLVRAESSLPIIVLSASSQMADKVRAFALGADDFVSKPYDPAELAARIEAVLRRVHNLAPKPMSIFEHKGLAIDFDQQLVSVDGNLISLTRTEYRLLAHLAQNVGRVLVADSLLSQVWGPNFTGDYTSLHLYISRLRHKLGEDAQCPRFIITKPGVGYMIQGDI